MNGFGTSPLELMACEAMLKGLIFCDEFIYSASWVADTTTELGSLATVEIQIQINGDSDFIVQEQNLVAVVDDEAIFPNYLLTITRSGSGREVMSGPQHVANICGAYMSKPGNIFAFPAKKPMPGLLVAKNTVSVKLQNLTTTTPDRVDLSFIGFKVFYIAQQGTGQIITRQQLFHSQF